MSNTEVLLISENYVRTMSNISNNTDSKFILPIIRETQDIDLQSIVGSCLYEHLKDLVRNEVINNPDNKVYADLLKVASYFLLYGCLERLCLITSSKISNAGAYQNMETGIRPFSLNEIFKLQDSYIQKKDFYAKRLQEFLVENHKEIPELKPCDCNKLRANLDSSASTGLFLGGMRGRYITPQKPILK